MSTPGRVRSRKRRRTIRGQASGKNTDLGEEVAGGLAKQHEVNVRLEMCVEGEKKGVGARAERTHVLVLNATPG
jgi:hypothetical protein